MTWAFYLGLPMELLIARGDEVLAEHIILFPGQCNKIIEDCIYHLIEGEDVEEAVMHRCQWL
jgi:hypothetical protein